MALDHHFLSDCRRVMTHARYERVPSGIAPEEMGARIKNALGAFIVRYLEGVFSGMDQDGLASVGRACAALEVLKREHPEDDMVALWENLPDGIVFDDNGKGGGRDVMRL